MSDTIENTINEAVATETTSTPTHGKNDKRRADLNKQVSKLGEEASLGRDSLPKLAHAVVIAANDGVISEADAEELYNRYAVAESKKAIHEHSAGGKKANISKLKQLIAMGVMTTIDPVIIMDDAKRARENMIADSRKVKSAYPFYVDVARAQLKTDQPLSESTLEDLACKDEAKEKTLEGELKAIMKRLEALVTGENKQKLHDEDERTEAAFHAIKERLEALEMAQKRVALMQKAKEIGLTLA